MVVLVLWIITLVLAPLITRLLAMAVSRKREYLADASGAQFTRNPLALAAALEKLAAATAPTRAITRGAAHLCIVDPSPGLLSERSGFLADVMTSHPPIEQRIERLKAMGYLAAPSGLRAS
jgi:heat shock protein HtpX